MELRFIDTGTVLTIQGLTKDEMLICEYTAVFYNILGYTSFFAESEELYKSFNELNLMSDDIYLKILFNRNQNFYSFKAKASKNVIENDHYLTQINQISDINIATRRTYPRLDIFIPVTLYTHTKTPLFQGESLDISVEGLCLLSNTELYESIQAPFYILEFILNKNDRFALPAKIVRRGSSPNLIQYKFDYGFIFDYTNNPNDKSKLVTSLFMHKMSGL